MLKIPIIPRTPAELERFYLTVMAQLGSPSVLSLEDVETLSDFSDRNQGQEIRDVLSEIEDAMVLLVFAKGNEQRLNDLDQKSQDNQTLYWMGT